MEPSESKLIAIACPVVPNYPHDFVDYVGLAIVRAKNATGTIFENMI